MANLRSGTARSYQRAYTTVRASNGGECDTNGYAQVQLVVSNDMVKAGTFTIQHRNPDEEFYPVNKLYLVGTLDKELAEQDTENTGQCLDYVGGKRYIKVPEGVQVILNRPRHL